MVELIAKKIGLSIANSSSASTQNSHASSEHTKELVEASWQAPGRKDRIIVREINSDGVKIKRTEQENNKYIESNPDAQIGLSKFANCVLNVSSYLTTYLITFVCAHSMRMYGFFCYPKPTKCIVSLHMERIRSWLQTPLMLQNSKSCRYEKLLQLYLRIRGGRGITPANCK